MPDRLSYDEAMLYASRNLKIQDPDLKQGAVETYEIKTPAGSIKKPWGMEGGFAVVYKYRSQGGRMIAMRCFRVSMNPDTQSRYERMSAYFRQYVPDITIDFHYYEEGILVKETSQSTQKKTCPVIVMEWIDGVTLLEKVDELCRRRDTQTLGQLAEQWLVVLNTMRQARMAHGDLAGLNVMVRKTGQIVLIDYDGVYIPEFANLPQVVLGQQGYQHPDMPNRPFTQEMDNFSALVIYLSLLALRSQPGLWDKYVQRNAKGQLDGNMLFTGDDFAQPDRSMLFTELLRSSDTQVRDFARKLLDACKQTVSQVRFVVDPDYQAKQALQAFELAMQRNDDEQIVRLWVAPLTSYTPAKQHQGRVDEARQRIAAVAVVKRALASQDVFQIADTTSPELATSQLLSLGEREVIQLALAFVKAYRSDDDDQMVNRWQDIQYGPHHALLRLGPQQQQRLTLAQQRKTALTQFRLACYRGRNAHDIVGAYIPILDGSVSLSSQEREQLEAARHYIVMYDAVKAALQMNGGKGDLPQVMRVYDEELDNRFNDFTELERKQLTVLRNFGKLDRALTSKAYRLALITVRDLEIQTRAPVADDRLTIARMNFIRAFEAKNLQVRIQNGQVFAQWDWPHDELIQFAAVVWRDDRWPQHPRREEPGSRLLRVNRRFYEQFGYFQFHIGVTSQIFVQIYFAISEFMEQTNEMSWFYSRGDEPTSKWPAGSI